jgi:hypothetical protein
MPATASDGEPLIYVVRLNVTDGRQADWDDWYARQHAPDVVLTVPGFRSARSHRVVDGGSQLVCSVYEIDDLELFGSDEYQAVGANDPQIADVRTWHLDHSASIYRIVERCLPTDSEPRPRFATPWLTTARFSSDTTEPGQQRVRDEVAALQHLTGFAGALLGVRTATHPRTPCLDPEWITIAEWDGESAALSAAETMAARFRERVDAEAQVDTARRVYEIVA